MEILGVDIGGSGIKAAPVEIATGRLRHKRRRIETPRTPTPENVADVCARLVADWSWTGPVGVGFPGVVSQGVVRTAVNLHPSWVGVDAATMLTERLGAPTSMLNDADAAGLAEVTFGAGAGVKGIVLMVTFGTGIGSGLFVDGVLVPNTELGHIEVDGHDAESRASALVRETERLSWKRWGQRVDRYLGRLENLLWPELIIRWTSSPPT
jgi:polyphosphate glucokinase